MIHERGSKRENREVRSRSESSPPMGSAYFLSLDVRGIRCFGDKPQHLDLSDGDGKPARWSVLLGENGTGKTTALQLLAGFIPTTRYDSRVKLPFIFVRSRKNLPFSLSRGGKGRFSATLVYQNSIFSKSIDHRRIEIREEAEKAKSQKVGDSGSSSWHLDMPFHSFCTF